MQRKPNRLADEASPYLRQHAHNPVDWHPWGPEALERAAREDKPIFLSIGYAACHWCHVMERESFEDEAIAAMLNQHFVSIKVDREERPDLDEIYMTATVAISGSGGWPMSVFLAPDQRPFFAGTYFPPNERYGRPGFLTVLRRIAELWREKRQALLDQAGTLARHVVEQSGPVGSLSISDQSVREVVNQLAQIFDPRYGGFGSAPKFPPSQSLLLLMRIARRSPDGQALEMVQKTLDGMKNGGIYDHLAGGFARYSTDERWLVPHFEKMLYDNAQLAIAYLEAFQITQDPEYRRVAVETLDYVIREMQSSSGGYYSATDADSEGEEGKFFVFTRQEIEETLSPEAADAFCLHYDVTPEGNWEGKSVLNTPRPPEETAEELGLRPAELRDQLTRSKQLLYEARGRRVPPLLDHKILTSWNGLMIGAMAEGHRVLCDRRYLESARRAAESLLSTAWTPEGRLIRTTRGAGSPVPGFLEDYAYLSDGLIGLFETSGERRWLEAAQALAERLVRDFSEQGGGFFQTARDHESLIARTRTGHDGAIPSPNAVAARALARLAHHQDRPDLRARAIEAITDFGMAIERAPRAFATSLSLVDFLLEPPVELVVAGDRGAPDTEALLAALARHYLPNRVQALTSSGESEETPLTQGKTAIDGRATLYICQNFACQAPLTDVALIDEALARDRETRIRAKEIPNPQD